NQPSREGFPVAGVEVTRVPGQDGRLPERRLKPAGDAKAEAVRKEVPMHQLAQAVLPVLQLARDREELEVPGPEAERNLGTRVALVAEPDAREAVRPPVASGLPVQKRGGTEVERDIRTGRARPEAH